MAKTALVVKLIVHEGRMEEFLAVVRAHGERTLALEPGCLRFDLLQPADAPDTVFLYELYRDEEALQAHWDSAHMAAYRERARDLLAGREANRCTLLE